MFDTAAVDRITFLEFLNDLLAAENTVIERLNNRILETPIHESKKILQEQLKDEHKQHSRLQNLIAYYGGKPTNSKADLTTLDNSSDSKANKIIKTNNHNTLNSNTYTSGENHNNDMTLTPEENESLYSKEDVIIKNAEILLYKQILTVSERLKAKDAISTLKQNLKQKELMFNKIKNIQSKMLHQANYENDNNESFKLGSAIGDVLTSYWNSKENPSKVYVFNRRVHHGGIGALLGLSSLYKNQPIITGILSGLGARLVKDDYKDSKEWFSFKKKENDVDK
jgi:ferritin-like metal-binding protein YciE